MVNISQIRQWALNSPVLYRADLVLSFVFGLDEPCPPPNQKIKKDDGMGIIDRMIGEDDGTFNYVLMRAFCIGVVLNPLLWLAAIAIIVAVMS